MTNTVMPNIVLSLNLPAGSYVVIASANIYNSVAAQGTDCALLDPQLFDIGDNSTNDPAPSDYGTAINVQAALTLSTAGAVNFGCTPSDANTNASNISIIAIQVGSLSGAVSTLSRPPLRPRATR